MLLLITGRSVCESDAVLPCPGKCLSVAATPAVRRPRTEAATWSPTAFGSEPNEREPITPPSAVPSTSASGAKSTLSPIARSSSPAAFQPCWVAAGLWPAPSAIALGSSVTPLLIRVTAPNSWSVPMKMGACAAGRLLQPGGQRGDLLGVVDVGGGLVGRRRVVGREADQDQPAEMVFLRSSGPGCRPCRSSGCRAADAGLDVGGRAAVGVGHQHLAGELLVGERLHQGRGAAGGVTWSGSLRMPSPTRAETGTVLPRGAPACRMR